MVRGSAERCKLEEASLLSAKMKVERARTAELRWTLKDVDGAVAEWTRASLNMEQQEAFQRAMIDADEGHDFVVLYEVHRMLYIAFDPPPAAPRRRPSQWQRPARTKS